MELKLILKGPIDINVLPSMNLVAGKLKYGSVEEVWKLIQQHPGLFLDEYFDSSMVLASYSESEDVLDFHDEDGTLLFYITK